MTTEERLREAARYLRTQHPRPFSCGCYIDELMERAAEEMDAKTLFVAQLALGMDEVDIGFHADPDTEQTLLDIEQTQARRSKVEWRVEGQVVSEAEFHAYAMRHPVTTIGE